jgi:DegV family protein with EDD domain
MAVAVVTDSTSDISQAEAARLGLTVVPLNIHFGAESLRDGVDIMPAEFFERLRSSKALPKTSQPSAGVFLEVYQRLAQETDEIVSIHLSSKLSGTSNSARAAREALGGRARVEIVDSETVSWPLGFAARAALEAAAAGAGQSACVEAARAAVARTRLYFVLDTLEYLQKGGRIGRARAFLGQVFSIKPILTVRGGEVAPLERVRSRMKAEERLFDLATAEPDPVRLAVAHSSSDDEARRWVERLESERPGVPVELAWLGPVVGVYAGPNTLGMAVVSAKTAGGETDGELGAA